ncbi:MAG: hypothetical protein ABSG62_11075 [Terracidiphilus sp.]|jgi:hypothetical protein
MFSDAADLTNLKQGDIVRDFVFPIARVDSTRLLSRVVGTTGTKICVEAAAEGDPKRQHHIVQVQGTVASCAVMSQCCDVDSSQNPPPHSFVLCKLVPVPPKLQQHRPSYETLIANVDPYGGAKAFIQNFWFGKVPGLHGEFMADFAQPTTISWADYQKVLQTKIAELDDLHRAMFRVKVGAHFGRVAQEDKAAGYEDPYLRPDSPPAPKVPYIEKIAQAFRLILGKE